MEQEQQCLNVRADAVAQQGPRALLGVAATVSGGTRDTEGDVIGQTQWQAIREAKAEGKTVSAIAREMGLDRKTVRSALHSEHWRPYSRAPRSTKLDEHMAWLSERAPQVNFSARILHQELRLQRGFDGSYEVVKVAVRPLRAQAAAAALTQRRFETEPGEQAQVDWGQVKVHFGEQVVRVHIFVMTLGYSRRGYAEGFLHERLDNLLAAHEHAFAHFGGRCENLLFDRMRTVVHHDREGSRLNTTFEAFAQHWGFRIRLCQPYRAKTKGKVESGVKYVKRNFVPGRTFCDLDDFNEQLRTWQAEVADVRVHGTTHQRPIDRFQEEAAHLAPTASQPSFRDAMVRERVVAEDWLISIEGNRYSVPFKLIGKTVQVVREGAHWVIRHAGLEVARHEVLAGKAQLCVQPEHGPRSQRGDQVPALAPPAPTADRPAHPALAQEVEVRDLSVYEQLAAALEAA